MSWWAIVLIVIAVLLVLSILFFYRKSQNDKKTSDIDSSLFDFSDKGELWEKKVSTKIKMLLKDNEIEYDIYNDLYLPNRLKDYSKISEIDHLLITKKNIYVIESKAYDLHENNQLIGEIENEYLYLYNQGANSEKEILNPLYQNKNHIRTFRNLFSSEGLRFESEEVKNIVVMKTDFYNRTTSKYDQGIVDDFYTLDSFLTYLFEIEKEINPAELMNSFKRQKIINLLEEIQAKKAIYKKIHRQQNDY